MPHRRTRTAVAAFAVAVVGGLLVAPAARATTATAEVYNRPSDGVFEVAGHGWGHGHGMSQWGADGAASKKSLTGAAIAAFYYPNTTQAVLPNAPIRVRVDCDRGLAACAAPQVSSATGFTLTDRGNPTAAPVTLPTDRTQWRVKVDSAGYHLQGLTGTTWAAYPTATTVYKGPVELAPVKGALLRVNYTAATSGQVYREYHGIARYVRSGTSTSLNLINVLGLEDYLLGVVPRESISSWPLHALFAQAIAARSYSAYSRAHVSSTATYDICDTTMCQVYWGAALGKRASDGTVTRTALEPASTTKAVRCYATYYPKPTDGSTPDPCSAYSGPIIRAYNSAPIFAQFSSSNGGWSVATTSPNTDVQKYLVAQQDPYDGLVANSVHSWSTNLPVSTIESAFSAVGTLKQLRITARDGNGDWGGRVGTVVLQGVKNGASTSVTVSGRTFQSATALKSNWFKPVAPAAVTITGPSTAPRATPITISGTSPAGTTSVDVWLQLEGRTSYSPRSVTPASNGTWSLSYTPTVNLSYYATSGTLKSATLTTKVSGTTISGPSQAPKGSRVTVAGWAPPSQRVIVCWRRAGSTSYVRSYLTASSTGRWAFARTLDASAGVYAHSADGNSPVLTIKAV